MSLYSKVERRMWTDAKFNRLSAAPPNGQTLWLRLITAPESKCIPGLIPVGEAGLAEALGWDLKGFREAFGEAFREGMVKADWKSRLIWIPNSLKRNAPQSPNVILSWQDAWDELPECQLKLEAYQCIKAFLEGLGEAFGKAFGKACRKPCGIQEQEQEQEQENNTEPPPDKPAGRTRGSRISPDWKPPPEVVAWCGSQGISDEDVERVTAEFVDYWVSESGKRAVKTTWDGTFKNRIRSLLESGRLTVRKMRTVVPPAPEPAPDPSEPAITPDQMRAMNLEMFGSETLPRLAKTI